MKNRRLFHSLLKLASTLQKPWFKKTRASCGTCRLFLERPTISGPFRRYAEKPFRDQWPKIRPRIQNPCYRVALFGGCVVDFVSPEQAISLVRFLPAHNVQMEYPMGQSCCGLPAMMMAEEETAKDVAVQNLEALDSGRYDYILVLCASCGSHLKEGYSTAPGRKAGNGREIAHPSG